MMKQAIVGASFVGLDFCPTLLEIVLHILGQFALGDESVEIIYLVMDGVFGSIQVINVVIMLILDEVLAHGLDQLQEEGGCIHIVANLCKRFDSFGFCTYLYINDSEIPCDITPVEDHRLIALVQRNEKFCFSLFNHSDTLFKLSTSLLLACQICFFITHFTSHLHWFTDKRF